MKFSDYIKAKKLDQFKLDATHFDSFATLLSRGQNLSDVTNQYADPFAQLPQEQLRQLSAHYRDWQKWRQHITRAQKQRETSGARLLPPDMFLFTPSSHQIQALQRFVQFSPQDQHPSLAAWIETAHHAIDLWDRAVALAQKSGLLISRKTERATTEQASLYEPYLTFREKISDVVAHRWLAMRRGEKEGVLTLSFEFPVDELLTQVDLYKSKLGSAAENRQPQSLLEELILNDLKAAIIQILDDTANREAVRMADANFQSLIDTPAITNSVVGGFYISSSPTIAGIVVTDAEANVLSQRHLPCEGNWLKEIIEHFTSESVQHVVAPLAVTGVAQQALKSSLPELEKSWPVSRIKTAALADARRPFTQAPLQLESHVASALVLVQRAIDPIKAWSTVDPTDLGLAEYQNDLDLDELRATLAETLGLRSFTPQKQSSATGQSAPSIRASTPSLRASAPNLRGSTPNLRNSSPKIEPGRRSQLNPLVQSLADLRPGMTVQGVISNIAQFGAFVDIGFGQDALVHISELSDEFVANPNDVVKLGQKVSGHILSVDLQRRRIAMSLKTQRPDGETRPKRAQTGKAAALSDLDKLFKK